MLSKTALRAFLTPIAFYRAINGSYSLDQIRPLTYGEQLSDQEWQVALSLYKKYLVEEQQRNLEQIKKHQAFKSKLDSNIKQLKQIVQKIPEIKDILLVNSYSLGALKSTSDIDLVVICEPKLLWWARLKLTAALEKAGLRRKPGHIEEQICLSFFVTADNINMQPIALHEDLYLHYWLANGIPLFGKHRTDWQQQNQWIKQQLPAFTTKGSLSSKNKQFSFISHLANQLVRVPMLARSRIKAKALGPESSIIINDNMLKFHNEDRRTIYKDKTLVELTVLEQLILFPQH